MKRPYVISHMMTSVDGRIDCAMTEHLPGVQEYYDTLDELEAPTRVSGKVTAQLEMSLPGEFHGEHAEPIAKEVFSKKKKAEGYTIYICSASVEAYLRFCKLPVDEILGTKTDIKDGKYTSQMIGKNCKNEEKVKRIQEVIKNHNLEIDYDLSYAYSDSLHDIPMLKMVKNRIKIDTKDGHMSTFEIE